MKKIIAVLFFVSANWLSFGQCSSLAVQISSSDTSLVQLYQAGFFLIPSGFDNVCEWEVSTFSGQIIHRDTTSGDANDQSSTIFNHSIPITDSMKVSILITNKTEGITCKMSDTLFWKETEVLPGSFIGNWSVLSSNGGVEEKITTSVSLLKDSKKMFIFPCPVHDYFEIKGTQKFHTLKITDLKGQTLETIHHVNAIEKVNMSSYLPGIYFISLEDKNTGKTFIQKIVKM